MSFITKCCHVVLEAKRLECCECGQTMKAGLKVSDSDSFFSSNAAMTSGLWVPWFTCLSHQKQQRELLFKRCDVYCMETSWLAPKKLSPTNQRNQLGDGSTEGAAREEMLEATSAHLCGEACVVWGLQFMSLLRNQTDMVPMGAQVGSKVVHKWEAAQLAHVDSSMGVEDDNITVPFGGAKIAKAQRES